LPSGITITNGVLSFYGTAKQDQNGATPACAVVSSNPTSNTALANSDFALAKFGTTRFATDLTYANFTVGAYNDFTLNASGIANIVDGITKFGTMSDKDLDNVVPTRGGNDSWTEMGVYNADQTGTTQDPKLVIEYTISERRIFIISFLKDLLKNNLTYVM